MRTEAVALSGRTTKERGQVAVIPTQPMTEEVWRTSLQMPTTVWEEMTEAAKLISEEAKAEGRRPLSRDDVITHACRWWLQSWKEERKSKKR